MAIRLLGDSLQPFQQYLQDYCEAYESLDSSRIGTLFSDDEVHCIGTGVDEVLTNRDSLLYALQRDFSELSAVKLIQEGEITALQIGEAVCLRWDLSVEYSLKASPGKVALMPPLRFSMVLEQQQGRWKTVQAHASAPLPTQDSGRSFPEV